MHDKLASRTPDTGYAEPVSAALECLEGLLLEGLKHGHFDYAINCEIGNKGRRLLIIRAGKNHKFTISETDVPR
ncbi:MAG: hypothetical protein ACREX4_20855 [Gammaproteobacteria bacterium]